VPHQCEDVRVRYEDPLNEADFREVRDIVELKYVNCFPLSLLSLCCCALQAATDASDDLQV
jgi:hypothetical protein